MPSKKKWTPEYLYGGPLDGQLVAIPRGATMYKPSPGSLAHHGLTHRVIYRRQNGRLTFIGYVNAAGELLK